MKLKTWIVLLLLVGVLAACNAEAGTMDVSDVWGRNSPMAAENGAFYMTITNNTGQDDTLLAADVDVCSTVELHEMYMKENDVMGMRQVPGGTIDVPDGEAVELKVGGLHVMCLGKTQEFALGDEFPMTLTFENAGDLEVNAAILDQAPGMDMDS